MALPALASTGAGEQLPAHLPVGDNHAGGVGAECVGALQMHEWQVPSTGSSEEAPQLMAVCALCTLPLLLPLLRAHLARE